MVRAAHRRLVVLWGVALAAAGIVFGLALVHDETSGAHARSHRVLAARAVAPRHPARPPCFGAAARLPWARVCNAPSLRLTVVPWPAEAKRLKNAPCRRTTPRGGPELCVFGVPAPRARATVALVGDSHAADWRAAFAVVAQRRRWRVIDITHTACPLSVAVRALPDPARFAACVEWKRQVFAWFRHRQGIDTVFVGGLSGGTGVVPNPGHDEFATAVGGYLGAWRRLLRTVGRIVVLRDTPKAPTDTALCLERAVAEGRDPGLACAVARSTALDPDPLIAAARVLHSPRVRTVDLTHVFCSASECFPVVGGVMVVKDTTHLTAAFSGTLGPLLAHELRHLGIG